VHREALFGQQGGMDARSRAKFEDGTGGWMKFPGQIRDIFGFSGVVLVLIKQILIPGVVRKDSG